MPEVKLARDAGLEIGETGGIAVNEHMRTSDPSIYHVLADGRKNPRRAGCRIGWRRQ